MDDKIAFARNLLRPLEKDANNTALPFALEQAVETDKGFLTHHGKLQDFGDRRGDRITAIGDTLCRTGARQLSSTSLEWTRIYKAI